jgi:CRP/FNR family transcriptional regulator, cyclic AMP receptor protein
MKTTKESVFDAQAFLDSTGVARKIVEHRKNGTIFTQGDVSKYVMYIQKGHVKLSVVNEVGKEAVVAMLGPGDFFGEGCLAGLKVCMGTATATAPTTVLAIERDEMARVLHGEHEFSDRFIKHMLSRNIRVEADLVDQLFNSTEKRLARTLLLLARYGKEGQPQTVVSKISQETLAEMIGTTRSRVNLFMNKFKKLGFVHNEGGQLHIDSSLLNIVLHEQ